MENLLEIITITLAFIAIILSIRNHRLQKIIANEEGVFRNPNLTIRIYDTVQSKRVHFTPEYFIIACNFSQNKIIEFPLKITLTNRGDKSVKECKLLLRYPKILRGDGLLEMEAKDKYSKEYAPKIIDDSNFQISQFEIRTITPKEELGFQDAITLSGSTSFNFDVDVVSKDGIPYTLGMKFDFFFGIDYTAYLEDAEPISGRIKIRVVDITNESIEEYIDSYNQQADEKYRANFESTFQHLMHCCKLKLKGKKTEKPIQLMTYDESKVKLIHEAIGRIPYETLNYYYGFEDVKGCIHIPEIKTALEFKQRNHSNR